MIIVYNEKFVAAVCKKKETLDNWEKITKIPNSFKIKNENVTYPFYILETTDKDRKYEVFQKYEDIGKLKKNQTIYKMKDDWQGQPDFSDYMGILDHYHHDEE